MPNPRIDVTANDQASAVLDRVKKSVEGLGKSFGGFEASALVARTAVAGVAVAVTAVSAAVTNALNVINWVDDLATAGSALGVTVENMAKYQRLASEAGVGTQQLSQSFGKIAQNVDAAKAGNREAVEMFRRLGISVKDLQQMDFDQTLLAVARSFNSYSAGASKAALENQAFGRSGKQLDDTLSKIAGGLDRAAGLSPEFIENAKRMKEGINEITAAWERMQVFMAGPVVNALVKVAQAFNLIPRSKEQIEGMVANLQAELDMLQKLPDLPQFKGQNAQRIEEIKKQLTEFRAVLEGFKAQGAEVGTAVPEKRDFGAEAAAERAAEAARRAREKFLREEEQIRKEQLEMAKRIDAGLAREQEAVVAANQRNNERILHDKEVMNQKLQKILQDAADAEAKIAQEAFEKQQKDMADKIGQLTTITESFFLKLTDFSGVDVFKTLAKDVAQLAYRMLILQPILDLIKRTLTEGISSSGGTGLWGIIAKILGIAVGGAGASGAEDAGIGGLGKIYGPSGSAAWTGQGGAWGYVDAGMGAAPMAFSRTGATAGVSVVNNNYVDSRSDQGSINQMLEASRASTLYAVREQIARRGSLTRV